MDPDDILRMHPGPKNTSLLKLQSTHRSSLVWEVSGGDAQRSRRRNPSQARFPPLHESMIPILQDLQFDGVSRLSSINIDWSLITALVERWRPETHTFHLPVGECTITLQDVSVLLGLRIDGDVVTGSTGGVEGGWKHLIQTIFGKAPEENDKEKSPLKGGRLLLSWLTSVCSELPIAPTEEEVRRYTQSYILQLIAGVLFTDHSGGQVHCMYIPLIQDFGRCRKLAWGDAVLAYLFRELCKSCRTGVEEIAGCLLLLQIWAWTRLPFLAPIPRGPTMDNPIWGDRAGPYGMRWCCSLKFTDTSSHAVSTHRLSLDALGPAHFLWQPYSDDILSKLPDHWKEGVSIWCYKGPLICFHIVEPHLPDRCMRQFGMTQDIPLDVNFSKTLHDINLQGKQSNNWRSTHHEHILHWTLRGENVIGVGANVDTNVVEGYDKWYTDITRRFHTRIAGSHFYSIDLLDHIAAIANKEIDGTNEDIAFLCAHGKQVLKGAFSLGVFQDFPIEDRREKEILKRPKPKKIGHKGGRGGTNAPKKDEVYDDVDHGEPADLDDDGVFRQFNNVVDDKDIYLGEVEGFIGDTTTNIHEAETRAETIVHTSMEYIPEWNLLLTPHSPQLSHLHEEQTANDNFPLLSHPTFDLGISQSSPFQVAQEPVNQQLQEPQQIQHPLPQHFMQKQPPQQQQTVQQHVDISMQQPAQESAQQPAHQKVQQEHMNLRPRKRVPPCCGTTGRKKLEIYQRRPRKNG